MRSVSTLFLLHLHAPWITVEQILDLWVLDSLFWNDIEQRKVTKSVHSSLWCIQIYPFRCQYPTHLFDVLASIFNRCQTSTWKDTWSWKYFNPWKEQCLRETTYLSTVCKWRKGPLIIPLIRHLWSNWGMIKQVEHKSHIIQYDSIIT